MCNSRKSEPLSSCILLTCTHSLGFTNIYPLFYKSQYPSLDRTRKGKVSLYQVVADFKGTDSDVGFVLSKDAVVKVLDKTKHGMLVLYIPVYVCNDFVVLVWTWGPSFILSIPGCMRLLVSIAPRPYVYIYSMYKASLWVHCVSMAKVV